MKSKVILVAVILLIFIGQVTVASALPCEIKMQNHTSIMNISSHVANGLHGDNLVKAFEDCCTKTKNCSMNGCVSLALPFLMTEIKISLESNSAEHPIFLAQSQIITPHFRPPITL